MAFLSFFSAYRNKILIGLAVIAIIAGVIYNIRENGRMQAQLDAAQSASKIASDRSAELLKTNTDLQQKLLEAATVHVTSSVGSKSATSVEYVPKTSATDADVEIHQKPMSVTVDAGDGNVFDMTPEISTDKSIKDGKTVVTTTQKLDLDIDKITQARYKDMLQNVNAQHEVELMNRDEKIASLQKDLHRTEGQRGIYPILGLVGGYALGKK